MAKLWEPKTEYKHFDPQSLEDLLEASSYPEQFLPYLRLYNNLTPQQLRRLISNAKSFHWEVLDLQRCSLHFLPDELAELTDLRILSLGNILSLRKGIGDKNAFTSLPITIGQLSSLQVLDLHHTRVETLPDTLWQLSSLRSLNLSDSQITAFPDMLSKLPNIQVLDLHNAPITALPDSIGELSSLQELDLHNTLITALPESIGQLSNLKKLDLRNCHLKTIPYSLVQLGLPFVRNDDSPKGNCINLSGTTLSEKERISSAQSYRLVDMHYQNRTAKVVNECKVIFLGDGAAGKSSLIERITNDNFPKTAFPTDGIKMTKWETALGDEPLTIRFLDFGGQEIMHSMHRCFLTNHTVYVVVCESRDDAEIDSVAARWMETVKSFAPECPVILALNKSDLNPNVTVNERDLKNINPQYRHMLHTSAKTGEGVKQLANSVLLEVPECLRKMNGDVSFWALKRDLENMEEDYLLPEQFQEKCNYFQIAADSQEKLINWFQDLGVAYVYYAMFQAIYVLKPEWLTNGIYRLILRTPDGGFLRHSKIRETLNTSYSRDVDPNTVYKEQREMEFILYVMRQFKISLELQRSQDGRDGVEMIPMKMDKTPPPRYDDFSKADTLHLRWEAGYLPNNLIHRLMIRKNAELDKNCVWRTGGWFCNTTNDCEALAEMTNRALDVYVKGTHDARVYMDSFRAEISRILKDLNIAAKEYVYCTVHGKTVKVLYDDVLFLYHQGEKRMFISSDEIKAFVSPAEILRENYVEIPVQPSTIPKGGATMDFRGSTFYGGNFADTNDGIQINETNAPASADLAELAKAIQNAGTPDPKKLASLKRELITLSKDKNTPMTAQMKMRPLIRALEAVQDDGSEQSNGKLWGALKPYIGDAENLSATLDMLGAGKALLLGLLRKIFLPV